MRNIIKLFYIICILYLSNIYDVQAQESTCKFPPTVKWDIAFDGLAQKYKAALSTNGSILFGASHEGQFFKVFKLDSSGQEIWSKEYGSFERSTVLNTLVALPDGGFFIGGALNTYIDYNNSQSDFFIMKVDQDGNEVWHKTYGGDGFDELIEITPLADEKLLLLGSSNSNISGDKSEDSRGNMDYWVIKTDQEGNKIWDKTYGGSDHDNLRSALLSENGTIVFGGSSISNASGEKSEDGLGENDYWLLRIDQAGNILWDKTLGTVESETLAKIREFPSGELLLGGSVRSGRLDFDFQLIKTDALGNFIWEDIRTGSGKEELLDMQILANGDILMAGESEANRCCDKSQYRISNFGDYWLIQIDKDRNKLWDLTLNFGYGQNRLTSLLVDQQGDYIIAGKLNSPTFGTIDNEPRNAAHIAKLDKDAFKTTIHTSLLDGTGSGATLMTLEDGAIIDINALGSDIFNLKVEIDNPTDHIRSLQLDLQGPINFQKTENLEPYTLFGENNQGRPNGRSFPVGQYTFSVTPYCGSSAQGTALETKTISFQVVGNTPPCQFLASRKWETTLGSDYPDFDPILLSLSNRDILVGGYTEGGISGDKTQDSKGESDIWISRLDAQGNKVWDKSYGGTDYESLGQMALLPDGNVLLGGGSSSPQGNDKSENSRGGTDYWLIKINEEGNVIWDKTYGGIRSEFISAILILPDEGILLAGRSNSPASGDKSEDSRGTDDLWLLRLDQEGNKVWDKTYGGSDRELAPRDIQMTEDGNFIIATRSYSSASGDKSQDIIEFSPDIWIIKINPEGDLLWEKSYDARGLSFYNDVRIIPGKDNKEFKIFTRGVMLFIDQEGNETKERLNNIYASNLIPLPDGGYLSGDRVRRDAIPNTISENGRGFDDLWIVRIDQQGNRIWDKRFGGSNDEEVEDMLMTSNGDLVIVSQTSSDKSIDKSEDSKGGFDFWVIRLDTNLARQNPELFLLDATTDQIIQKINSDEIIDLNFLSSDHLAFEIKMPNGDIGSLDIDLTGPISLSKTENSLPFSIFGENSPTDFKGRTLSGGNYAVSITPYCENDLKGTSGETQEISFSILPANRFTLVNADTEEDIQVILQDDIISLEEMGTNRLSIRFDAMAGHKPDSVVMKLSSTSLNHQRTERLAPYALFGGEPASNYYGRNFCSGNYTIQAVTYLDGEEVISSTANFQLVGGNDLDINTLTLINAQSNQDMGSLGTEITQADHGFSIRADVENCAKSVKFILKDASGQVLIHQTESISPYALLGDAPRGNYHPWLPEAGDYTLEVTAYSEEKAQGVAGATKIISLKVIEGSSTATGLPFIQLYPNPSSNEQVHLSLNMPWADWALLTIRDRQGRIQLQQNIYNKELDLDINSLKSGFYIINIQNRNGSFNEILIRN